MTLGPRLKWSGVKGEVRMMLSLWWPWRRQPTAGMRVMKERSQNRPAVEVGRWTVWAQPGIGRPGGVPSTYLLRPNPWDEWDSWRGGPPCGGWHGSRDRWGHRPSLRSDGRLKPGAMATVLPLREDLASRRCWGTQNVDSNITTRCTLIN